MFPRPNGVYGNASEYSNQVASVNYASGNANEAVSALAFRSSSYNPLYYNPAITYRPWANADGSLWADSNPLAARYHPARGGPGTLNLTTNVTQNAQWVYTNNAGSAWGAWADRSYYPATYARFLGGAVWTRFLGGAVWNAANYQRVEIKVANAPFTGDGRENRTDVGCVAGSCSYTAEIQNFAHRRNSEFRKLVYLLQVAAFGGSGRCWSRFRIPVGENARWIWCDQ